MNTSIDIAKAEMLIRKPVSEVFEAFVNPEVTKNFWFTDSSGILKEGAEVVWTWAMYNLNVPVSISKIVTNESIHIDWGEGPHRSSVKWEFKSIAEDKTFVTIANYNFQGEGDTLIEQVKDSIGGFTLVVAGLKAWLEHGVNLDLIGDKFPKEMMD